MPAPRPPSRARRGAAAADTGDLERAVEAFIDQFAPDLAALIRACRIELRRQLTGAFELVYDNDNFFVIGFCPVVRPSSRVVSLAAPANGVALSFYRGADVPDPDGLL